MNDKPQFHGSDLESVEQYYHIPQNEIVCFSSNVNPLGLSAHVKQKLSGNLDIISSYPDRNYTGLRNAIGKYCKINPDYVVVGNGATELISLLIKEKLPKKALLLGPTYSEYERELSLVGGEIFHYTLKASENFQLNLEDFFSHLTKEIQLLIICNPNNPTSSAISNDTMEKILKKCQDEGIFVMIDETYVEFAPDLEKITSIPLVSEYSNVMVLRGVSKFFASPGLRLGYGVTSNSSFLSDLKEHQNPWSLNSVAAYVGELLFSDEDYILETKNLINTERERFCTELSTWKNIKFFEPLANFILVKILKENVSSFDVFEYLIKRGIMIRDCSSFESLDGEFFRFCILSPEDNDRLLFHLKEFLED